ncbi:MAG: DUF3842 family protein [Clostridia bacterium]|nr:DUF3842 family protein [Clostridia bacterium]
MRVVIIDGQGGRIGRALIEGIKEKLGEKAEILAVGTNSIATAGMIKAGADHAATGENAVIVACREADVIVGPVGIVLADALLGEVTAKMAVAVASSNAQRVLIPFQGCNTTVVGASSLSLNELVQKAVDEVVKQLHCNN